MRPDAVRERCKSFAGFVKEAWHILEPHQVLVWGLAQDAICMHLQAITDGTFLRMGLRNRLLMNVPPGSMKSLLTSVFWLAWEWGPLDMTSNRAVMTSYGPGPIERDNLKFQQLVTSDWFQGLWPTQFVKRAAGDIVIVGTGSRQSAPVGSVTSLRGDRVVYDDPHSTTDVESEKIRGDTVRQFREGITDRLNNIDTSAIVVIMQRLNANDVSGMIEREMPDYIHLMLPMEFEPDRRCKTPIFTDPRAQEGELLDAKRFPPEALAVLKRDKGSFGWAGQYQQRPSPREGNLFKRAWFADKLRRVAPVGTRWVRHWDLAGTDERENNRADRTAGVKLGKAPDGSYWIADSKVLRAEGNEVRLTIKSVAQTDGKTVEISLPQDPGQAGKVQAKDNIVMLAGFVVRAQVETGDKYTRAEPFSVQCEAGNVYLLEGEWNGPYLDEVCEFPSGQFDDQVDATSGAFGRLIMKGGSGGYGAAIVVTRDSSGFADHPEVLRR